MKETKHEWPKKTTAEQDPLDPAMTVNWEDATALCARLTERKRQAGRIGANDADRLPTHQEWNCAVGN